MLSVLCTALNSETGPHFDLLGEFGFRVDVVSRDRNLWDSDVLYDVARDYDAVIAGSEPWPRALLERLPRLRVLSRTGVGFDAIDLAACDERQIVVATTPGVNHHAVAEHTLSLLLGLARGFPERDRRVRSGRWERISTPRLMGRTLGIIGFGRIGQAVATRAAGLGMRLLAYDPYPNADIAKLIGVEFAPLETVWAEADYITLHLPADRETRHLINERSLARMRPGVVLINTARGALIDEKALYVALRSGQVRAAGLDVFETEPLPLTSPLLECDNVMLSGHVAGLDDESQFDTLTMAADTIVQLRRGQWPAERIRNLSALSHWTWSNPG